MLFISFIFSLLIDVHNWTNTENIEQHFPRLREQQFDGKALYELKHLIPPQKSTYFFENICETLQIGSIGEKMRFVAAIRKLWFQILWNKKYFLSISLPFFVAF